MLKETLRKIHKAFTDGPAGFRDTVLEVVFKKDKKKQEEDAPWWTEETESEDKKVEKPTIREKFRNIKRKFTTGPKPFVGSRRMKRLIAVLLMFIYMGIVVVILGMSPLAGIFFVLTVYILIDYLAITRETDVWRDGES